MLRIAILIAALLFHVNSAHAALTEIPDVIKSEIPPPEIDANSWLVVDFATGWILGSNNRDAIIEPASLTKLMTSYLVFEALQNDEIKMEDQVYISKKAWQTGGSKMFIQVDTHVTVLDLLQGLIVQSGNDSGVALAEHIGGTEEGFAARMNLMAKHLGMSNTNFKNSSGLPEEGHYSTASDLTLLSIALIRQFPKLYRYYAQPDFTYNGIKQGNRNVLLSRDPTADGVKTGHTENAGYCLIGTTLREDVRYLATVIGSNSKKSRTDQVQALLQYGYGTYDGMLVFKTGAEVKSLPLWMGEAPKASIGVNQDLGIIFPKGKSDQLSAALELPDSLHAPITSGVQVGHIQVKFSGKPIYRASLHVNDSYVEGPLWSRLLDMVKQLIF